MIKKNDKNDIKHFLLDATDLNDDKEKPASSISGSYHDLQQLENEEDKEKSTEIFVDAIESFQQMINEIGWYIVKALILCE